MTGCSKLIRRLVVALPALVILAPWPPPIAAWWPPATGASPALPATISSLVERESPPLATQEEFLDTFDEAWSIIYETHWDPEFNGIDWLALREELRPRAAAAESPAELRDVINEMIARLDQSHFSLWPRGALAAVRAGAQESGDPGAAGGAWEPGFETVIIDDRFVVVRVDPSGPAAAAGVLTGWVVLEVDGVDVRDALPAVHAIDAHKVRVEAQRSMDRRLTGRPGSTLEILFRDGDDVEQMAQIERVAPRGELSWFGNMPPLYPRLDTEVLQPDRNIKIGRITFNIWLPVLVRPFDQAIDEMRDSDGIVLDLRGNPGGVGGMVMGVGGHFVDENLSLGTMRTRESELQFRANPRLIDTRGQRVEPFSGPLAILIDNTSASTSEVFAAGLQAIGRARVFGQRSMGAVLPSLMDELPNGDVLQHAFADFFISSTGVRLEGRGVLPDEEVVLTREDLLAGRDPTLEAAVEWIVRQR